MMGKPDLAVFLYYFPGLGSFLFKLILTFVRVIALLIASEAEYLGNQSDQSS